MNAIRLFQVVDPQAAERIAVASPLRDPSVVHASHGRLRVHLPHWSGTGPKQIAAAVQRLGGVTGAEANPLTGNLLIRFDSRQTDAKALLEGLPAAPLEPETSPLLLCGAPDSVPALLMQPGGHNEPGAVVYMTGTGRVVYQALGWTSVGMAVVGAILPGIPTAPFVILAGYFFVRSSPEAHAWLRQSRVFGPILRDWEVNRGVRRSLKTAALALIGGGAVLTSLMPLPGALKATIIALQALGFMFVTRLRVVEPVVLAPGGAVTA